MKGIIFAALALGAVLGFLIWKNLKEPDLGVHDGSLSDCPGTPNCVSSKSPIKGQFMSPFQSSPDAIALLADIVSSDPYGTVVEQKDNYLRALYKSPVFRFRDDVEFYLTGDEIQVRSASRVGYSDLGVNRSRIEKIREAYNKRRQHDRNS